MFHIKSLLMTVVAAAVAAFSAASPAQSPCFQPDGFSLPGACCVPTIPTLPAFPPLTIPGSGACFENCTVVQQWQAPITLSAPAMLFCDVYIIQVGVGGIAPIAPGLLVGRYTRTWEETNTAGTVARQVWRFLINADLNYILTATSTAPCPFPKNAFGGNPIHFMGSLDYARDCQSGQWSAAINMTHLCGDFMHNSFSAQPITPNPNPNHMYSFAGPTPFIWAPSGAPSGPAFGTSARSINYNFTVSPLLWQCFTEVPINQGILQNVANYCPCTAFPGVPPTPAWIQQQLNFSYGCNPTIPGQYTDIPWPPLVPTGLSTFQLGRYANAGYPAGECISLYFGLASAPDPCGTLFPFHVVMGIGTIGGDLAIIPNSPVASNRFLDLQNVNILIGGPPFIAIGMGGLFLSTMLWSLNF